MKRLIPTVIALALIAVMGYFVFYPEYVEHYEYSEERSDLMAYFGLADEAEVAIILHDENISKLPHGKSGKDRDIIYKARYIGDAYYFDLRTVRDLFNSRFYVDERENLLLYSLPDDTVRVEIGSRIVAAREGGGVRPFTVALYEDGILYLAVDFVKEYTNFSYQTFTKPRRMQVDTEARELRVARINRGTAVRFQGGIKSPILADVTSGAKMVILEEMETWAKVKTADAFIGYVELRRLGTPYIEAAPPLVEYEEPHFASQVREHKISLGWHYVAGTAGNDTIREVTRQTEGLNVISPTWFILNDNDGNITSFASHNYVQTAHDLGLEVWGLVENITNTIDMYELLSATSKRAYLIENLITLALEYGIDGINVDFEDLRSESGEHFVQFIRELSIPCREHGLVLSVDNYVPYSFNEFYGRGEQGVFADYVIIMGYDEHYRGSEKAGSVASINFVEHGIVETVKQVPAHKVINGVPFYTRIWETKGNSVTSQAVGMELANNWVANRNTTPVWNEETCQNYVEYLDGAGARHQVWLEDGESLRVKFNVMHTHGIGGVAFWQLGQETADIWDVVLEYLAK